MLDTYESAIGSSNADAWYLLIQMHLGALWDIVCIKLEGDRIYAQVVCELSFGTCGLCSSSVFIALFSAERSLLFSFCFAVILVFLLHICFSHGPACVLQTASLIWIAKIGAIFPGLRDEALLIDGTSFWNAWARILKMMLYTATRDTAIWATSQIINYFWELD